MAKQTYSVPVGYEPDPDNLYNLNKKEKATPYYLSYLAAYNQRPFYEDPVVPVVVDNRPLPKRLFCVIIITVLMAALLVATVLSFMQVLPDYTGLFTKIDVDNAENNVNIGVDDVIYGSLRKIFSLETEGDSVFYNDCLYDIENASTAQMIAYYALPVSLILMVVIAIYILIKAFVACFTPKRRKFSYISLLLILFTLIGVVSGIVWNGQALELDSILGFFTFASANISIGIGYFIIIGIEIIAWIFSMCAYRSKKKCKF